MLQTSLDSDCIPIPTRSVCCRYRTLPPCLYSFPKQSCSQPSCHRRGLCSILVGARELSEFCGEAKDHCTDEDYKYFLPKVYNYVVGKHVGGVKFFAAILDHGPTMYGRVHQHPKQWKVEAIELSHDGAVVSFWQTGDINLLKIKDEDPADQVYLIGLWDSTTVLPLFCMSPDGQMSLLGVVRELVQWGIPFLTLKPLESPPSQS